MKIILQKEVGKLGAVGDVVEVKDGFARNYLLPRGLAIQATRGALQHIERMKTAQEARAAKGKQEAEALAAKVTKTPVQIPAPVGEEGRLFGSVTAERIAEAVSATLGQELDRRRIMLEEPIRSTGTHEVQIHLHPEVNATLTVFVVPE
jgi:large subunit ribosomal protein L9